ncbi:MAG: dephospho-CoA kinase, partial [Deltaproteobacteria bacterium]|nr:dephospho-CoA kinase [Deltaproteobacteria bacterium]
MIKVAVTGGAGGGKSTVCRIFKDLGAYVVDLDRLARQAVEPGSPTLEHIATELGPEVIGPDGALDRTRVRGMILRNAGAKARLERVIHPEIFRRLNGIL